MWRFRSRTSPPSWPTGAQLVLGPPIAGFVVLAGEELSWGQRLVGWSTPSWFPAGNAQHETNLHNFFTEAMPRVYPAPVLLPLPVLLSLWLARTRPLSVARLVLPHPSLIGLSLVIAFVAVIRPEEQELLEELLAFFVLAYSLCILGYSRRRPTQARSPA